MAKAAKKSEGAKKTYPERETLRKLANELKSKTVLRSDGKPWTPSGSTQSWIIEQLRRVKSAGMTAREIADTFPHRGSPPNKMLKAMMAEKRIVKQGSRYYLPQYGSN